MTPCDKNLKGDVEKIKELLNFQIENMASGIVFCGTTGEAATLNEEEYILAMKTVVDEVKGRIKVVAGAGSNSTEKAVY
ncbi:dihydrodipicolinate synthase family protein, partial [Streptobacillus felis]|uniref:dihydrodipicolinate synthase family protein n=1 Tax=Streptobacillus felis TaxID=1384509 RepID=UPI0022AA87DA